MTYYITGEMRGSGTNRFNVSCRTVTLRRAGLRSERIMEDWCCLKGLLPPKFLPSSSQ